MLVSLTGEQEELTCFERDAVTEVFESCSVNWENQLFVFGGWTQRRRISRLSGHKLEHIGDLPFNHYLGTCNAMSGYIYLCFDADQPTQCRRSTGPLEPFSLIAPSTHAHGWIQTSNSESKVSF